MPVLEWGPAFFWCGSRLLFVVLFMGLRLRRTRWGLLPRWGLRRPRGGFPARTLLLPAVEFLLLTALHFRPILHRRSRSYLRAVRHFRLADSGCDGRIAELFPGRGTLLFWFCTPRWFIHGLGLRL